MGKRERAIHHPWFISIKTFSVGGEDWRRGEERWRGGDQGEGAESGRRRKEERSAWILPLIWWLKLWKISASFSVQRRSNKISDISLASSKLNSIFFQEEEQKKMPTKISSKFLNQHFLQKSRTLTTTWLMAAWWRARGFSTFTAIAENSLWCSYKHQRQWSSKSEILSADKKVKG